MKRLSLILPLAILLLILGCGGKKAEKISDQETKPAGETVTPQEKPATPPATTDNADELAIIETKFGNIELEFYPDVAPGHVANFKKLAKSGYYDGCTFHRVIPGFMIQGGDPNSKDDNLGNDGMGGPDFSIPAEFNKRQHLRGVLSMARTQDPNSAGSQFFICVADCRQALDNKYTVFGQVIKGMDAVDKIVALPRNESDNPGKAAVMTKVSIVPRSQVK